MTLPPEADSVQLEPLQAAHAAALAALPGIGPAGLAALVSESPPIEVWDGVLSGRIERPPARGRRPSADRDQGGPAQAALFGRDTSKRGPAPTGPRRSWAEFARRIDPVEWWRPKATAGIRVTWRGGPGYPDALADDPEPPGVLFWRGTIDRLDSLCVAIVGTRNATPDGRATAFQLARDLASAGVCIVSGLALGIDGAAHAGALAAVRAGAPGCTVGIAASGVDVPYPRRHTGLWEDVASTGAILSETPPGRPAQAWRFPSRNRVIAGLVRMVVVVESHMCGGSLITAEAAIDRGVEVRVVPGPVHSPASAGSNQLLYDGPGPVRDARDVLDALGMLRPDGAGRRTGSSPAQPSEPAAATTRRQSAAPTRRQSAAAPTPRELPATRRTSPQPSSKLDPAARLVLEALGWRPCSTNQIMDRTGLDAATALAALDLLVGSGNVASEAGWWVRRS